MRKTPKKYQGGEAVEVETRDKHVGKVVQMLDRVHCHARKRLRVCVPVVERMHVLVDRANVDKPMSDIKVDVAPHWNDKDKRQVEGHQLRIGQNLLVGRIWDLIRRPQSRHYIFPERPLHNTETPIPDIVRHVAGGGI